MFKKIKEFFTGKPVEVVSTPESKLFVDGHGDVTEVVTPPVVEQIVDTSTAKAVQKPLPKAKKAPAPKKAPAVKTPRAPKAK
jgi:hypothetical protein